MLILFCKKTKIPMHKNTEKRPNDVCDDMGKDHVRMYNGTYLIDSSHWKLLTKIHLSLDTSSELDKLVTFICIHAWAFFTDMKKREREREKGEKREEMSLFSLHYYYHTHFSSCYPRFPPPNALFFPRTLSPFSSAET
jgi:hypothetical protein